MKKITLLLACTALFFIGKSQTNLRVLNAEADLALHGQYDPNNYFGGQGWAEPEIMAMNLQNEISADSLKAYILKLSTFGNRNTGSDTSSVTTGFGAARRWVYSKFEQWANEADGRQIPTYFQFDQQVCGMGQHRNILSVQPGFHPNNHGIVIIEGHMDSRCAGLCDIQCDADGIEDNATGTALVMEMARVFSKYRFRNTLVFMVVTGEEQGLIGSGAFAEYCERENLPVRAVQNNDVVGGIHCGETSSSPSCPGIGHVDSVGVRLFAAGGMNKQLYRYIKLQYLENLLPIASVPMDIRLMASEDRSGRGSDHIPFRQRGFPAMRFCAANEHGDANVTNPNYHDRQHTSDDILGVDTDNDGVVDSFFVDFNYLARNTVNNANSAAMIAKNIPTPTLASAYRSNGKAYVEIADTSFLPAYRIMIRSLSNDWDSIYTTTQLTDAFPCAPTGPIYVSVSGVDPTGVESLFSPETFIILNNTDEQPRDESRPAIQLLQNRPNPFDEETWIGFYVEKMPTYKQAEIRIHRTNGTFVEAISIENMQMGLNEVLFQHGWHHTGVYVYGLYLDGILVEAREMVFAN